MQWTPVVVNRTWTSGSLTVVVAVACGEVATALYPLGPSKPARRPLPPQYDGRPSMLLRCLKRGVGSATVAIAVSGVAGLPSVSAARTVRAHAAATNCKLPGEGRTLGATYVEKLTVSGTTCTTGIS